MSIQLNHVRVAVVLVALASGERADACALWNQAPHSLYDEDGRHFMRPFSFEARFDPGKYKVKSEHDAAAFTTIRCKRGETLVLRVEAGAVVAVAMPRKLRITADLRSSTITVSGPRKKVVVRINGTDIPADAKGTATATVDLREALLGAPVGLHPDMMHYGFTPVRIEAEAGADRISLYWAVEALRVLKPLQTELAAVATTPLGWAGALDAAVAAHPGIYVGVAPYALSMSMRGVNGLGRLRDAQIIAVGYEAPETLESCSYDGRTSNLTLNRLRDVIEVKVHEATTGRLIATETFRGGDPEPCPKALTTWGIETSRTVYGTGVADQITAWLAAQ